MSHSSISYLAMGCRILLLVVFAVSAWSKARDRAALLELADSLVTMRLAPAAWRRPAAVALLVAEALTALLLALPWTGGSVAFGAALALLLALTGGVAVALHRRVPVGCRCFGGSSTPLAPRHLARNLALVAVAVAGLVSATVGGTGHPGGLVVAGAAGALLAVLVIVADDIAALFDTSPVIDRKGF